MRVKHEKCPVCSGKNFNTLLSLKEYSIMECRDCLFCFCNDYEGIDYSDREDLRPESQWRSISQKREYIRRFSRYARIVKRYLKRPENWLDVGANLGFGVLAAQSVGFKASGIEPERRIAGLAREKYSIDIKGGYLEDLMDKGINFRVVSYYDVIEHIAEPLAELNRAHNILKENGFIVIRVPNAHRNIQRLKSKEDVEFFAPDHKNYFTFHTLKKLLETAGFSPVKYILDEPFYSSLYQLSGHENRWKIRFFKYILYPLVKALQLYNSLSITRCKELVFFARKRSSFKEK